MVAFGMPVSPEETTELIGAVNRLLRQARTRLRIQQKLAAELKVTLAKLEEQQKQLRENHPQFLRGTRR
jgi:uncharacterized membrane-anchored protein YhcB (DUF1043 family)